jgi:hypothetical protein
LTVVVLGPAAPERTVESVLRSARAAGVEPELLRLAGGAPDIPLFPLPDAYAKHRALRLSSTPLVAYVRAGAVVDPGWVSAVLSALHAGASAMAAGPVLPVEEADAGADALATALARRLARATGPLLNTAVRRERALEAGGFVAMSWQPRDAGAEDLLLLARLLRRGARGAWCRGMAVSDAAAGPQESSRRARGRVLGRAVRRAGLPAGRAAVAALRSLPAGEAAPVAAAAAAAAGLADDRARSPLAPLERLPPGIRAAAGGSLRPLPPSPAPKTHLMYAAGSGRILHLYVDPSARLRAALADREAIRASSGLAGIPALHAVAQETDAIWTVEDRLVGSMPGRTAPAAWFPAVAEWAVRLAQPAGPSVAAAPGWHATWDAFAAASPARAESLRAALEPAEALPAVHMHGDLQRRNVLLGSAGVGVIDWEGAWHAGIPGLDLVFLALLARGDRPDPRVIEALLQGRDPAFGRLRDGLRRVGVAPEAERSALLMMLVTWAVGEQRRFARSGRRGTGPFAVLLARFAHRLA